MTRSAKAISRSCGAKDTGRPNSVLRPMSMPAASVRRRMSCLASADSPRYQAVQVWAEDGKYHRKRSKPPSAAFFNCQIDSRPA